MPVFGIACICFDFTFADVCLIGAGVMWRVCSVGGLLCCCV